MCVSFFTPVMPALLCLSDRLPGKFTMNRSAANVHYFVRRFKNDPAIQSSG